MSQSLPPSVHSLRCILCGWETPDPDQWACPSCGPESRMDVVYVEGAAARLRDSLVGRPFDMWRYRELLPIPEGAELPPLHTGGSPLYPVAALAETLGIERVVLKDDGRNPSASLKDRPSAVAVLLARAAGAERVICASTGNAASSLACHAASVGLPATIFVPRAAPAPKIAQLRVFGAQVFRVDADYDRTWDLAAEVAAHKPWYNRNCAVNPYLVEGKKTVALELAEQLGDDITDWVVLSVGDGCTVAAAGKGLREAHEAGLIPRVPKLLAVQAEGSAPLAHAAHAGAEWHPEPAQTLADSISVGHPRNPLKALRAVSESGGDWITVSDEQILGAIALQGRASGVFGEPAAAAALAGLQAAVSDGLVGTHESATVVVSGNGLKDAAGALKAVTGPQDIPADLGRALELLDAAEGVS